MMNVIEAAVNPLKADMLDERGETMTYTVTVTNNSATIDQLPNEYLHFGHHDFAIVWNEETNSQDVVHGKHTFYGGIGEGSIFDNWQDAIHASLYDLFQVSDNIHDGDRFVVTYNDSTQEYVCSGFHVLKAQR